MYIINVYVYSCSQYYESHAFLRDLEMREALKYLLTGLSELNFDMYVSVCVSILCMCVFCKLYRKCYAHQLLIFIFLVMLIQSV